MSAHDWVMQFLVGGLFGALGQSLRVIVGLKKLNDSALLRGKAFGDLFSSGTLVVSLLIGAIAGVLGTLTSSVNLQAITRENVVLLIGIGYAVFGISNLIGAACLAAYRSGSMESSP